MPKPKTTAVLSIISIAGKLVEVSTAGTRAAPGSSIIDWSIDWKDGTVNKQVLHHYDQSGDYHVALTVTDSKGRTDTAMIIIRLTDIPVPPPPDPLQFVTPSLPGATVGVFYSQSLQGTGGVPPYSWALVLGALPNGLALVNNVIQGTPTTSGTFNFRIRLQDSVGTQVFRDFTIAVTSIPLVITSTSPLPNAAQSEVYSFTFVATGGVPPYSWSKISGNFPTGITLSGAAINGTPPNLETQVFTMRVTDSVGGFVDKVFSLTVVVEGPNDYYNELLARPDFLFSRSLRDHANLQTAQEPLNLDIISSTAATPAVIYVGEFRVNITSSVNGLVTCAGGHSLPNSLYPTTPVMTIDGHSFAPLNGNHRCVRVDSLTFTVAGMAGSGSGGTLRAPGHLCSDGQLVTITGHGAIPNGTYVARVVDISRISLETLAGSPVAGTGGGAVGTITPITWEYAPGVPRVDSYPNAQIGAKGYSPIKYGPTLPRGFHYIPPAVGGSDSFFTTFDEWYSPEFRNTQAFPFPIKAHSHLSNGVAAWLGPRLQGNGRTVGILSVNAGSPVTINLRTGHFAVVGDVVSITGNSVIPNGNYTITQIVDSDSFRIAFNSGSSSGQVGQIENLAEIGRINHQIANPGLWVACIDSADSVTPTGTPFPNFGNDGNVPAYHSRWTRYWNWIRLNLTGDDFPNWNANIAVPRFFPGYKIGQWNCSIVVDGAGVGTVTIVGGPHGYDELQRVSFSGIAGLTSVYTIATIPVAPTATVPYNGGFTGPTTFTINGLTPGLSGSGVVKLHFSQWNMWIADVNRNAVPILLEVPALQRIETNFERMNFEWDSSDKQYLTEAEFVLYARNFVVLKNPTNVDPTLNPNLFRKPVG